MANKAANEDGWTTVSETFPTRVAFEKIGEELIGRYKGQEKVETKEGSSFWTYLFTEVSLSGVEQDPAEVFSVAENGRIKAGMKTVRPGMQVRIRYSADIPTQNNNPLKDYEIATRR